MATQSGIEPRSELQAEAHAERLTKNVFAITMLGALGFFVACAMVMF